MTKSLFVSTESEKDIDESFSWYEMQQRGLGARFISVVDEAFIYVRETPKAYPIVFKNMRKQVLRKFPFNIYYRNEFIFSKSFGELTESTTIHRPESRSRRLLWIQK